MKLAVAVLAVVAVHPPAHRLPQRAAIAMGLKGPPPIPSKHFVSLTSPGNLTEALAGAASDVVTVVKYQAPWCRTCRAMAPLLDRQAKKHQELRYFSLECRRDGKAAGERMHKFFVERGAKGLPFVEVYRGDTLLEVTYNRHTESVGMGERHRPPPTERDGF